MEPAAVAPTALKEPGRPEPPPLALYVHFPWCLSKCPYCDFNSHAVDGEIPEGRYLDCLRRDLECFLPEVAGRPVHTVYLGGGTPSLLSPAGVDRLLSDARMLLNLLPGAEITMEANPGAVELERYAEYVDAGVNRLSLGIQSLDDGFLRTLGRIHDSAQARAAVGAALDACPRVNLDMIYALPGQDLAAALRDARELCALGVEHVSLYHLMLEPGTVFYRSPPPGLPGDDLAADIEDSVRAVTEEAGYGRYEVSAHSRPGAECRHNLNYWRFGDYLGIGAGAHAKITDSQGVRREMRHKAPARYMEQTARGRPQASAQRVKTAELSFEFMLNALRLTDGFDEALFVERTGLQLARIGKTISEAESRGWLERTRGKIRPTRAGLDFLVDLCALFLPPGRRTKA